MIDSIMTITLLIGILWFVFFTYRKLRIDLFRDSVFKIRRSLFLIAVDNPDEFFKQNSPYRFFETILNATLSNTENFSLLSSLMETAILDDYAKRNDTSPFDFEFLKKIHLKKIKSPEVRKKVAAQIEDFEFHYVMFLLTRTFIGLVTTSLLSLFIIIFFAVKVLYEQKKETEEKSPILYSVRVLKQNKTMNKTMNNVQFAYATSKA